MDIDAQLELTSIDLSGATVADLIKELKQRCVAVACVMVVIDESGEETTVCYKLGTRVTCIGAMYDAIADMTNRVRD